jgi:chromate transporter
MENKNKLLEVGLVFFKLGCFAFGGPAAHIAMMEAEIIAKRKWMTHEHFLDLIGATNLIPGPNSTEMTMHCGHERAGRAGLFVAGIAFIFPAVFITGLIAWVYTTYGHLPKVEAFFFGIKPAVLVIILGAVIKLGKKALKNWELGVLGTIVLVGSLFGFNEITLLLAAGFLGAIYFSLKKNEGANIKNFIPILAVKLPSIAAPLITVSKTFFIFLKVGAVLYGGGYVLFAYLDAELVANNYLTRQELIDAIAIGQFTPGPVLSTATFIGYQLTGFWGAIAATAGIFLPSFIFTLILNPFVSKIRKSPLLSNFLDSVNIAAVAVIGGVMFEMGRETLVNWQAFVLLAISFGLTFGIKKLNPIWVIITGSILGYLLLLV